MSSPLVKASKAIIPTPVFFWALSKVPVVAWPTNKLFVKFVPSIFIKSPVGELITGEVKVLFVRVCVPVKVTTPVALIAASCQA